MRLQAICRVKYNAEAFLATKQALREAMTQVKAVLKAFSILKEAGVSIDNAELYITALDSTNVDGYDLVSLTLRSEEEASEFLAAIKEALGG